KSSARRARDSRRAAALRERRAPPRERARRRPLLTGSSGAVVGARLFAGAGFALLAEPQFFRQVLQARRRCLTLFFQGFHARLVALFAGLGDFCDTLREPVGRRQESRVRRLFVRRRSDRRQSRRKAFEDGGELAYVCRRADMKRSEFAVALLAGRDRLCLER